MKFGRIASPERVDFELPPSALTRLQTFVDRPGVLKWHIGLPIWAKRELAGHVYPAGTKSKDYLRAYSQLFDAIELNPTHYAMPTTEKLRAWAAEVPPGFQFSAKVPQSISHERIPNLAALKQFSEALLGFGTNLGPCFLQYPDHADLSWKRQVFEVTRAFPQRLALELRHPSWFAHQPTFTRLCDYLCERQIAFVITDTAGRRDAVHMAHTAPFAFIRFLGDALISSDFARLDRWFERLETWAEKGLRDVYFYMHQEDETQCIPLVEHLRKRIAKNSQHAAWLPAENVQDAREGLLPGLAVVGRLQ